MMTNGKDWFNNRSGFKNIGSVPFSVWWGYLFIEYLLIEVKEGKRRKKNNPPKHLRQSFFPCCIKNKTPPPGPNNSFHPFSSFFSLQPPITKNTDLSPCLLPTLLSTFSCRLVKHPKKKRRRWGLWCSPGNKDHSVW